VKSGALYKGPRQADNCTLQGQEDHCSGATDFAQSATVHIGLAVLGSCLGWDIGYPD
jgi:hypothetical protein